MLRMATITTEILFISLTLTIMNMLLRVLRDAGRYLIFEDGIQAHVQISKTITC